MTKIGRDAFLYLAPKTPTPAFAQCETCNKFSGSRCTDPLAVPVVKGASCGFYAPGAFKGVSGPMKASVTSAEAGLVVRPVRCENCRYGGERCELYAMLNRMLPEHFALDEKIEPQACCNANMPKESDDGDDRATPRETGGPASKQPSEYAY